jgi:branched-chain amino acid transport system permease protein
LVSLLAEALVLGLMNGLLFGVLALGLNIVWGVMNIINIAHGDFVIIGAFASYWLFVLVGVNPFLSLLFTIPFGFALGAITYVGLVKRIQDKPELMSLLLTFGLSIFIEGVLYFEYGPSQVSVPYYLSAFNLNVVTVPQNYLFAAIYAILVALVLRIFLMRTFWGKAIRAVIEDRTSSLLVGINPNTVGLLAFGIGISIATSVGSVLMLNISAVTYSSGAGLALISFVIVVLGGQGSPLGSIIGGVVIGIVESFSALFLNAAVTPAIAFLILVAVLVVRPQGIMGSKSR